MPTQLLICCGSQCAAGHFGASRSCNLRELTLPLKEQATPRGFEPLRAEPNGFRVHPLGHSGTVSCEEVQLLYDYSSAVTQRPAVMALGSMPSWSMATTQDRRHLYAA